MNLAIFHKNFIIAALVAILVLFPAMFLTIGAASADKLSDDDKTCLGCHAADRLKKDLGGGKLLSSHVAGDGFAKSAHGVIGCASRHADVDLKTHPQKPKTITSSRDYPIPGNCREGMNGKFPEKKHGDKSEVPRGRIARACTASPAS